MSRTGKSFYWQKIDKQLLRTGVTFKGCRVSFKDDENFLKLTVVIVAYTSEHIKANTELYILNGWIVWYMNYSSLNLLIFFKGAFSHLHEVLEKTKITVTISRSGIIKDQKWEEGTVYNGTQRKFLWWWKCSVICLLQCSTLLYIFVKLIIWTFKIENF